MRKFSHKVYKEKSKNIFKFQNLFPEILAFFDMWKSAEQPDRPWTTILYGACP